MTERVAVITGGSRGIGLSFATTLVAAGYRVSLTASRNARALSDAVDHLSDKYGSERVLGIVADATDPAAAEEAVTQTRETFGRIDILINNAGRGPREISEHFHQTPPKFWEVPPPAWERIVSTNVNGPYVMARAAAPHMVANGWGRIIGISTSRVTMVAPGFAPYGPTKAALDAMTSVFAKDLKGTGVTANILLPGGPTDTSFIPEDGRTGRYLNLLPVDIMNDALLWLVSDDADDVTGARLVGSKWQREDIMAGREDTGEPPLIL